MFGRDIIDGDPENAMEPVEFFEGRTFKPPRLARRLIDRQPIATDGLSVHAFEAGTYRPGEELLKAQIIGELGDDWTRSRRDETIAHLRDHAPALDECPPLDRINVLNGILHLADRTLHPHDPKLLSPVQIPVAYDPEAECPRTDAFLESVLPNAPERELVIEYDGLLLTPDMSYQKAAMFAGSGSNGKSVKIAHTEALIGPDNCSAVPLHQIGDRFSAASLRGKLVNSCADLDARAIKSAATFKAITGGDAIQAERKYHDAITFRPYTRLLFSANEAPPTADGSLAFFRRWLIVPFEQRFDGKSRDRNLLEKITTPEELSGYLNRALDGLDRLRARGGFASTKATDAALDRFRTDADTALGFIEETCEIVTEGRIARPELYARYREWCEQTGRMALAANRFNERIRSSLSPQVAEVVVNGTRYWTGIRLAAGGQS